MAAGGRELRVRSFREGDERILSRLFNTYLADFLGPIRLTPREWRAQFRRQSWTGPSLTDDRDACRIAEAGEEVLGYAVTDYQPNMLQGTAVLQELCAVEEDGADRVLRALIADAEKRARERGKLVLIAQLSPEDGRSSAAAEAEGFDGHLDDGGVLMAAIGNLRGLMAEIEPALSARLGRSTFADWRGTLNITDGEQSAGLEVQASRARARAPLDRADIRLTARPEALALLVFGRERVGELYVQDSVAVDAEDTSQALRLLDVLFPRVPMLFPRAQWW